MGTIPENATRIVELVGESSEEKTYKWIQEQLGLTEQQVFDAVDYLHDRFDAVDQTIGVVGLNMRGRLLYEELMAMKGNQVSKPQEQIERSRKVFVVHGHDESAKHSVARLLEKLKFEPIILREQPSFNLTLIEKLEHYSDVAFAVVILTGDDIGYAKNAPDAAQERARQNVILELGYFLGLLKRKYVCALLQQGVEKPSDYDGVMYVPLDAGGAWKYELARELRAAGFDVDMNLI